MLPSALPFKSGPLQDKKFLDKALFFFFEVFGLSYGCKRHHIGGTLYDCFT